MAKFTLRTLGPVHIGNGVRYSPFEFFYDENKLFLIPDHTMIALSARAPDLLARYICGEVRDQKDTSLLEFLKVQNLLVAAKQKATRLDVPEHTVHFLNKPIKKAQEIHATMHTLGSDSSVTSGPYVPGTSLKGAIITAVLSHMVMADTQLRLELVKAAEKLGNLRYPDARTAGDCLQRLLDMVFGPKALPAGYDNMRPNYSALRFLEVGDSQAVSSGASFAAAVLVTEWHSNRDVPWGFDNFVIWQEAIRPGIQLDGTRVTVRENLYSKKGQLEYRLSQELSEPSAGFSAEVALRRLKQILHEEALRDLDEELSYFKQAASCKQEDMRPRAKLVVEQLDETRSQSTPSSPVVRIGADQGLLSTTLARIVRDKAPQAYTPMSITSQKIRGAKYRDAENANFPITRRICKVPGGKYASFGWCKLVPE